jgi:hypothetical protein
MKIIVKAYSRTNAKVSISHNDVSFDAEMLSKEQLRELLSELSETVEDIEDVLERLEDV